MGMHYGGGGVFNQNSMNGSNINAVFQQNKNGVHIFCCTGFEEQQRDRLILYKK